MSGSARCAEESISSVEAHLDEQTGCNITTNKAGNPAVLAKAIPGGSQLNGNPRGDHDPGSCCREEPGMLGLNADDERSITKIPNYDETCTTSSEQHPAATNLTAAHSANKAPTSAAAISGVPAAAAHSAKESSKTPEEGTEDAGQEVKKNDSTATTEVPAMIFHSSTEPGNKPTSVS